MKLSVIIPSYNRKDLLEKTLESLFGQTRLPDEIIVIDDGSTDGTLEYLRSLGDRVVWQSGERRGPGPARNLGMALATGEWLAFLDSDDLWFPTTCARYLQIIRETGAAILFGKPARFWDEDELSRIAPPEVVDGGWEVFSDYFTSGDKWRWWGASSFVIEKSAIRNARFADSSINGEDADFLMQLGDGIPLAQVTVEPTFAYREHAGSIMRDFRKTVAGARWMVNRENSDAYPGGDHRRRERRTILGRQLRPVILELIRNGERKEGLRLFRDTFGWHLAERRGRFMGAVLLAVITPSRLSS